MSRKQRFGYDLSPRQYVSLMFRRTDEDGFLYIPGWFHSLLSDSDWEDDSDLAYECRIDWNKADRDQAIREIEALLDAIERIDALSERYGRGASGDREILEREGLLPLYDTYLRPFDEACERFDPDRIFEIRERVYREREHRRIAEDVACGRTISEADREALAGHLLDGVSEEEKRLLASYREARRQDAEARLGKGLCALEVLERAAIVRDLMRERRRRRKLDPESPSIGSMNETIRMQSDLLAAAFVIHRFGQSMRRVDPGYETREETILRMGLLEEDGVDTGLYDRKAMNSRKNMATLFVYLILRRYSSPQRHLTQKAILDLLAHKPFEITMERKALSRAIHTLEDSELGIRSWRNDGVWYDPDRDSLTGLTQWERGAA